MSNIKKWVIHAIFRCHVCEKEWQDHTNARKKAYEHAKATGHKVTGESAWAIHYN